MTIETELPAVKVDIVERLRSASFQEWEEYESSWIKNAKWPVDSKLGEEAADEITALRTRCEKAEAERDKADSAATYATAQALAAESRCEELAEALGEALEVIEIYADPAGYTDGYGDMWPSDAEQHEGLLAKGAADKIRAALSAYRNATDDLKKAEGVRR